MDKKLLHGHDKHTSGISQHNEEMCKANTRTESIDMMYEFLHNRIERDRVLLSNVPVLTDSGLDISSHIRGRMNAYLEVKSFIERGGLGVKEE